MIVITGTQRCGTTALRECFASNGAVSLDEILHGTQNHPWRFFTYLAARIGSDPSYTFPLHHLGLFDEFVKLAEDTYSGSVIVADVKYEAYNLFNSQYDVSMPDIPHLIRYFSRKEFPIIHMARENKLRAHISRLVAEKTGIWGSPSGEVALSEKRLTVDPTSALEAIEQQERAHATASHYLSCCDNVVNLHYESAYQEDGRLSASSISIVEEYLGIPISTDLPPLKKQNPEPLSELIINYDDLETSFRADGRYRWMLDE